MISKNMPRQFWSYTAGKGSALAEARESTRQEKLRALRQSIPGFLAFGGVLLLTLIMLLMIFAEFRGFYIGQIQELLTIR
jgi:hypothetical protein